MAKNGSASIKDLDNLKKDLTKELIEIKVEIVGEIKDMREEFSTHQYSHQRINDGLQNHDKRIGKLESTNN